MLARLLPVQRAARERQFALPPGVAAGATVLTVAVVSGSPQWTPRPPGR
jgi:hypothetical protein